MGGAYCGVDSRSAISAGEGLGLRRVWSWACQLLQAYESTIWTRAEPMTDRPPGFVTWKIWIALYEVLDACMNNLRAEDKHSAVGIRLHSELTVGKGDGWISRRWQTVGILSSNSAQSAFTTTERRVITRITASPCVLDLGINHGQGTFVWGIASWLRIRRQKRRLAYARDVSAHMSDEWHVMGYDHTER
jgi:hypothetical protein